MRSLAVKYGANLTDMMGQGAGTNMDQLARVLEDNNLKVNFGKYIQAEYFSKIGTASEDKPLILHVDWFAKNKSAQWVRTGGHFVVCVGQTGSDAIILDPWSGLVEIPIAAFPEYNPKMQSYGGSDDGVCSGWMVQVI